ncbi:MAG TPA: extensin family protein [Polyangiaceae bacterium]|nr:extensin family protein [Polyangiaceae bacterium]
MPGCPARLRPLAWLVFVAAATGPRPGLAEPDEASADCASYQEPLPSPVVAKSSHASRWASLTGAQCLAEVSRRKLAVKRWRGTAVGVQTPVRVTGAIGGVRFVTPGAKSPYGILDCRLALAFADLAELLRKHDVVEVRIDNMYRPHAHLPGKKKPSQHSFGLAVDLTRLKLENGQELVVERDFDGAIGEPVCGDGARASLSSEGKALRDLICDVARSEIFHHILTPNHDAAHKDHFHLDIARGARSRIIE